MNLTFVSIALLLAVGAGLSTAAGFIFNSAGLLLVLGAAVPYPIWLQQVIRKRYNSALGWVLFWAVCQSLAIAVATVLAPEQAAKVVFSGTDYTAEMFHWIRTGEGAEGSLALFLPIHLKHYALFCLLSLVTLGSAALLMGTWLLNYMNFYVAQLVMASTKPGLAAAIAWPPWSLLRVVGFIATGIALTSLGLALIRRIQQGLSHTNAQSSTTPVTWKTAAQKIWETDRGTIRYLLLGLELVAADIVVKAAIAPVWQKLLLSTL